MDLDARAAFDRSFSGEVGHALECLDVFGTAIGVPGVIERVHSDEDVARFKRLCPRQSVRQKDRVARGNVGDGNCSRHLPSRTPLGHGDVIGESRVAEDAQIDTHRQMPRSVHALGHARRSLEFHAMPLAVIKR